MDEGRPVWTARYEAESGAQIAAMAGALVGVVLGLWLCGGRLTPLWGAETSVGLVAAFAGAVTGLPTAAIVYLRVASRRVWWRRRHRLRRTLDVAGVSVSATAVPALVMLSTFAVFGRAFRDLALDGLAATTVVALVAAAAGYALALLAYGLDTRSLAVLLLLFVVGGVFASMLTADDPAWWTLNFSMLGAGGYTSSAVFNVTIIVAGVMLLTLADYLTIELRAKRTAARIDGVVVVRTILVIVGVALSGVGLVPVDVNVAVHNTFAITALVGFATLMGATPALVDGLPRTFLALTTVFAIAIGVIVLLFWPVRYLNLTAVELLAVLLIFVWLIMFTRNTPARARTVAPVTAPAPVDTPGALRRKGRSGPDGAARALGAAATLVIGAVIGAAIARRRT
ncbi:DUF998 domain-containing protein [Microbacterium gilvum]|uniref:DUF998 domain-containing protein n=1 Tax=Microbacterium gilvum TaxID=1336204 RepID=UPI0031E7DCF1